MLLRRADSKTPGTAKSRENHARPSEIDREEYRARVCARISFCVSRPLVSALRFHPLDAVLFKTRRLFISDAAARRPAYRHSFHERIRIRERGYACSALLRFLVSISSPTRSRAGTRGWTRRISQSKHQRLSSSRAIHLYAPRRDYLRNEKHSSCRLRNFLLEHRHVQIVCIYSTCIISASRGKRFRKSALSISRRVESDNRDVSNEETKKDGVLVTKESS